MGEWGVIMCYMGCPNEITFGENAGDCRLSSKKRESLCPDKEWTCGNCDLENSGFSDECGECGEGRE